MYHKINSPVSAAKQMCFYIIICNDMHVTECYVGSTSNFANRKIKHKSRCVNPKAIDYNIKLYRFIRDHGGWENWSMVIIDIVPCDDRNDTRQKERSYIVQCDATLNSYMSSRTPREYAAAHPVETKASYEKYNRSHRQERKEWANTKRECECGGRYTLQNKLRHERTNIHIKHLETKLL